MEVMKLLLLQLLCLVLLEAVVGKYVSSYRPHYYGNQPSSSLQNRDKMMKRKKYNLFKSNLDIMHYLKLFGTDMMIWRCKNAIQPVWDSKPIPMLELKCETLGVLKEVSWYHNGQKLEIDNEHYMETIKPHMSRGRFFSAWLDFNLKIFNATLADAGLYAFKATSRKGFSNEHNIYVDISKKKEKKHRKRNRKGKKGKRKHRKRKEKDGKKSKEEYDRFYLFHKYHNQHINNPQQLNTHNRGYLKEVKTGKNTYYTI